MTRPVVAVTGGTGFVGRACAAALARAGWHVRILVRRDWVHPVLAGLPIEPVWGDLGDEASLGRLVEGASAVVHAAGLIKARHAAEFMATNRDGTGRLAAIVAREAPDCRFVHISSQAARVPELSPYAASKRAGEAACVAALGATPWVLVRPGVIYGPWDQASVALMRLANGVLVPVPAPPEPRLAIVHVQDVADAIVALCTHGPSGARYELHDGAAEGHAWRDIVQAAAASPAPRFVQVPDFAMLTAGRAADLWADVTGRAAIFGLGKSREILHRDWRPDPALKVSSTLWSPKIPLRPGFTETRAWWFANRGRGSLDARTWGHGVQKEPQRDFL